MKELTERIKNTVKIAQNEEEFPESLAVQVLDIADNIEQYSSIPEMIQELILMVSDYDIYAGTCCGMMATADFEIEQYLEKIRSTL
ncbi:MAG: hypothetical protein MI799_24100 [Desulfobacterales bacterium]|nr:hypothetical protein [Desulfobacterales bacterium]